MFTLLYNSTLSVYPLLSFSIPFINLGFLPRLLYSSVHERLPPTVSLHGQVQGTLPYSTFHKNPSIPAGYLLNRAFY